MAPEGQLWATRTTCSVVVVSGWIQAPFVLARKTPGASSTQWREWMQRLVSKRTVMSFVCATLGSPAADAAASGCREAATRLPFGRHWTEMCFSKRSCRSSKRSASVFKRRADAGEHGVAFQRGGGGRQFARAFAQDLAGAALHELAGRARERKREARGRRRARRDRQFASPPRPPSASRTSVRSSRRRGRRAVRAASGAGENTWLKRAHHQARRSRCRDRRSLQRAVSSMRVRSGRSVASLERRVRRRPGARVRKRGALGACATSSFLIAAKRA